MKETWIQHLGWEDPLAKGMATHSSTLAWRIPWTEELGRLQSMGLQRVGHYCVTNFHFFTHINANTGFCGTTNSTLFCLWVVNTLKKIQKYSKEQILAVLLEKPYWRAQLELESEICFLFFPLNWAYYIVVGRLNGHCRLLNGHHRPLNGHRRPLNGNRRSLNGHRRSLKGHRMSLKGHHRSLNGHRRSLNGHCRSGFCTFSVLTLLSPVW